MKYPVDSWKPLAKLGGGTMFEQLNMFEQMQTSLSEIDCVCMDIEANYRAYLEDVQEQIDNGTWDDGDEDGFEIYAMGFSAFVEREFETHACWCPGSGNCRIVSLSPGGARVVTTDGRELLLSRAKIEKKLGL